MFSTIKAYALGIGVAILAVFYALFKAQRYEIKDLKRKNEDHEAREEIADDIREGEIINERAEADAKLARDVEDWKNKI